MTPQAIDPHRPLRALVVALCLGALIVGCTSGSDGDGDGRTSTGFLRGDTRPVIRLGVTPWTGARLNVAIVEQLVERRLGYPVLAEEVTDNAAMMRDLESGELDAVLEIWPSSLEPSEQGFLDDGVIDVLGPLGVKAEIGWWVPSYVVENDPALATWEGYADPSVAARFGTGETGGKGRFLGTDPAYAQVDEQLIEALDLPFEVVYSGSDQATADEVEARVEAGQPVLLYWWSPTALVEEFDLVRVTLPERTEACLAEAADGGLMACDYSADELLKLASPRLAGEAPDLHAFLTAFSLSASEQAALIQDVEVGGGSIDEVAAAWIAENRAVWEAWLVDVPD